MNKKYRKQSHLITPRYFIVVAAILLILAVIAVILNQKVFLPAKVQYDRRIECSPKSSADGLFYTRFYYDDNDNKIATVGAYRGGSYPISEVAVGGKHKGSTISEIEKKTFLNSYFLEKVTVKTGIETIADEAFLNCPSLKEIYIPPTVKRISNTAFSKSENVKIFSTADSYAAAFAEKQGIPFEICDALIFEEKDTPQIPKVAEGIHEDVWVYNTFWDGKEVRAAIEQYLPPHVAEKEITIPATFDGIEVCAIGRNAFQKNADLQEIYLPETIVLIGEGAFADTQVEKKIYLTENVVQIAPTAFFESADKITLCAPRGSYAEQFAKENNIKFEATE